MFPKVKDKSSSTSATTPASPLQDRTNEYCLDSIKATPPMPSFQKPTPEYASTAIPTLEETPATTHPPPPAPTPQSPNPHSVASPRPPTPIPVTPHPYASPSPRLPRRPTATPAHLPACWTSQHDRAICYLDIRGYSPRDTIRKLRTYFPDLRRPGASLTPATLEMRLSQLDQNPEVTYWGDAMRDLASRPTAGAGGEELGVEIGGSNSPGSAGRMVSVPDLKMAGAGGKEGKAKCIPESTIEAAFAAIDTLCRVLRGG